MLISQYIRPLLVSKGINAKLFIPRAISINMSNENLSNPKSRLAVFDFDCTVINTNSDEVVQQLLPNGPIIEQEREFIVAHGWTKFMAKVFGLLHQHNVTPMQICNIMHTIPEVPGMINLLRTLHSKHNCEIIIISDANSIFINEWLKAKNLQECIAQVFTNPAHFDDKGALHIAPYHFQDQCKLSAPNLCKGQILQEYIKQCQVDRKKEFAQVIYAGDGQNDLCPALRLTSPNDLVCAREGFSMVKNLQKYPEKYAIKAKLIIWKDGIKLLSELENFLVNN